MEVWDLYTENRELSGQTHIRGDELPENLYHLVVHVWIRNSKGQYLISQRAADRPTHPLMWETAGGSVIAGETSLQGALREVKEEVGVDLEEENGRVVFSKVRKIVGGDKHNDILDVWLFSYDGEADLGKATTAEVAQIKWADIGEIRNMFDENKFVRKLDYFFDKINR